MNKIVENTITQFYKQINRDSSDLYIDEQNMLYKLYQNGYTDNVKQLFESGHEVTLFDEFIDDIFGQDIKHVYETTSGMFKTGYYFYTTKKIEANHIRYIPHCEKRNDIGYPIFIDFEYNEVSEQYASVKNRQISPLDLTYDNIIIVLNMFYIDDVKLMKSALKHELTHVIPAYIKQNFNNLNTKKNTICYSIDNYNVFKRTFNLSKSEYDMLSEILYLLNKSEQEAFINGTLQYISDNTDTKKSIQDYIRESYITNKLDRFEYCFDYLCNTASDYFILIVGYYMQFHHYLSGNLTLEYVKQADIKMTHKDNVKNVLNYFSYYYEKYKKQLINAISRKITIL